MHYHVEPEVAGQLGPNSRLDASTFPPKIKELEYIFDGWLGDALLECFPCFILKKDAADAWVASGVNGFDLDIVSVGKSDVFEELYPGRELPGFYWLKPKGSPTIDDVALSEKHVLVLSKKAIEVLRPFGLDNAELEDIDS